MMKSGISVCMIVRNEEKNIAACIESLLGVASEFVIVDTGSTDRTKQIIESYREKVEIQLADFVWVDNFAFARNVYLSLAHYEFIFQVDADERISKRDHEVLRQAAQSTKWDSYRIVKRSYVRDASLGWFVARPNDDVYEESKGWPGWCAEPNDLLFRNVPGLYYRGCVHESITYALADLKSRAVWLQVPIHHYGRNDMSAKEDKYLELVQKRCKEEDDAESWNTLGTHYDWMERNLEAVEAFKKSLEKEPENERPMYGLAVNYQKLKRHDELYEVAKKLVQKNPRDFDIAWTFLVQEEYRRKNLLQAISWAKQAIEANPRFFHVRFALSTILTQEAKNELSVVLSILPQYELAQKRYMYLDISNSLV
jgi:glycosyltransferase involved in cell wall biosynthesis